MSSFREEKGVRFLIIILQELRVQAEIIDFGRNASKVLLSVRKLEEREVCLGTKQQQQQIRQKWKLLIEILFGVNMRSMSTCLLVLQFLNISWKARRLFLWRRLIQESLGLFSQRINLAESSIYHRRRSNSRATGLLACFHKLMAEKAENMYEWPDSEGKQVLCHSAHAKRVTSMTLDHTARTYPCRHSGQ